MNKKNSILIGTGLVLIVGIFMTFKISAKLYEEKVIEAEKINNAIIEVELVENLDAEFTSSKKVSDFITSINGEIVDDFLVNTTELGEQSVFFEFINDDDVKVPYSFKINIKDVTPPVVWLGSDYYITTKFDSTLEEKILCADDHDDKPVCKVEGEFDMTTVGKYDLNFKATDQSGNETNIPFTLHVTEPSSSSSTYNPTRLKFKDMITKFKNEDTSLGIDVSSWQGDIDFNKVKDAGVEFAFVRVGSKWGMDGDFFLDSKFERNMHGFNDIGIPVGAYFYSYARDENEAREEAEWMIDKLKDYKVDLPVAFDFEDWSRYNAYKMSLYRLNRNAEVFISTLKEAGYDAMLYGSLNYLNRLWKPSDKLVWGAHYTTNADYRGKFDYWQFSSAGIVDGISGNVDLNIMYK